MTKRFLYIALLPPLGAAAQQNDEQLTVPTEIDSIARAAIDPQLRDAFAERLRVRGVAFAKPIDRNCDQSRSLIVETIEPAPEGAYILIGDELLNLDHLVPLMLPYGKPVLARGLPNSSGQGVSRALFRDRPMGET